ncbi:ATP-binding protein [Shinella sp. 838]|uniref:ATP-binding protein n=1 Tax=unclassified Shinella TaxID=2643062 RepID=UPI0003C537A1|nr:MULTISPECIES: ATP-binding protein [unclassified Shinella]EYR82900.1 hypothetical protein SHLA_18c001050 [Shinella sp. DD12]MCA0342441.1 ATP-binding protein [Pseudomonadota bacterium]MDG4673573.1 ATP-binding protein [Shinella sp. 838]
MAGFVVRCEGTGMGLAIVSQVMSTHGGSVGLGDAVGGGLAASLVFPSPQKGIQLECRSNLSPITAYQSY